MKRIKYTLPRVVISDSTITNDKILSAASNIIDANGDSPMFILCIKSDNANEISTGYIYQIIKKAVVCWTFDKNNALYKILHNINNYYSAQLSELTTSINTIDDSKLILDSDKA